jgi:DNA-binding NtrC family response regulator
MTSAKARILLIEDHLPTNESLVLFLRSQDYEVDSVVDGNDGMALIRAQKYDVVVTDRRLPGLTGDEILRQSLEHDPDLAVILITGHGDIQSAVEAMRVGAFDYLTKPFKPQELVNRVKASIEERERKSQSGSHRRIAGEAFQVKNLVGNSQPMQDVLRMIDIVADKNCTVLITGETGTGKELAAKAIHYHSSRANNPIVCMNCSAIPENLLEDELFGHVKGAYTSAHNSRVGRIEQADKGTLFLDEIGSMHPELQVKLLRVLQEREFQRLGSNTNIRVDVRILAATNMDLLELVKEKKFRADLYYRLNVFPLALPPLRSRKEDISMLAEHFLKRFCALYRTPRKKISRIALEVLNEYDWPGNVRELENVIESAVILSEDSSNLEAEHLPTVLRQLKETMPPAADLPLPEQGIDYQNVVYNIERNLLLEGLRRFGGNRSKTANYLNLKRTTLLEKMKRLKLSEWDEV